MPDASDTTLRRKLQALNTNRRVLQEAVESGVANRILLNGAHGTMDESQYIVFREAVLCGPEKKAEDARISVYSPPQLVHALQHVHIPGPQTNCICATESTVSNNIATICVAEPAVSNNSAAIRVALIGSAYASSYAAALQAAYITVPHLHALAITCYDLNNFDGDVIQINMYDVVVLYAPTVPVFNPHFGANLNAYMARGGNSVITQFLFGNANGPSISGFDYSFSPIAYNNAFAVINPETYFIPVGTHSITTDIDTYMNLDAANIGKPVVLQEGSITIATFNDRLKTPFIIVNSSSSPSGKRRSVAINRHPRDPSLFTDTVYNQLIVNSIVWASGII